VRKGSWLKEKRKGNIALREMGGEMMGEEGERAGEVRDGKGKWERKNRGKEKEGNQPVQIKCV